ncbi:MAG: hypothetical protein Ct9H300mP25_09830 [Acidobacteriota bacterium]|nr:MAG: hypothetical protein Ct9H300mP25_09830 [Acidobacteriota bacterium]
MSLRHPPVTAGINLVTLSGKSTCCMRMRNMRVRFPATAGPHVVSVTFVRRFTEPEGVLQPRQSSFCSCGQ